MTTSTLGRIAKRDKPKVSEVVLEQHRQRLIEGLAVAIREKGLAGTRVTDIVKHAHASRSTFYRCFEDKDACFVALAQAMLETTRAEVAAAIDAEAPWETQVDQAIDAFLELMEADHALTVSLTNDLPLLGERGAVLRVESNEKYAELVATLTQSPVAKAAGIEAVSIDRAVILMAGIEGAITRTVRRGGSVLELAPVAKDVVKRVLAPT